MSATDAALRKLEQLIAKDPVLSDMLDVPATKRTGPFEPDVDILETSDCYVLLLDVPGIPKDTLEIWIDGSRLTVSGKKPKNHPETATLKLAERRSGNFQKEFQLPTSVDGNAVRAQLADGLLRIELPRSTVEHTRKVTIL